MFEKVLTIVLPNAVVSDTQAILRKAGRQGYEAFVLWAGKLKSPSEFHVSDVVIPEQHCYKTEFGVGVHIDGSELFRLSKMLFEQSKLPIAQVHSHPSEAYHSPHDDEIPLVTAEGQFSLVVPNFAYDTMKDLSQVAVFRLSDKGEWIELSDKNINSIFVIK